MVIIFLIGHPLVGGIVVGILGVVVAQVRTKP